MKKQKVFIPVSAEDEIPSDGDTYFCERNVGEINIKRGIVHFNPHYEWYEPNYTHWLKEQEGYFFTPEELRNLIRDVYGKGSMADQDCSEDEYFKNKKDYIESLNIK